MSDIFKLENVLSAEGDDFSAYSQEAKSIVLRCATTAGSVKAILDTPILTEEGALTEESLRLTESIGMSLESMR